MSHLYRKLLSGSFLLIIVIGMVVRPLPVQAQGIPVIDITNLTREQAKDIGLKIVDVLKNTALLGIRNTLNAFLGKLAYDSAVWVASTGTGQQGLVYDKPPLEYFADTGDAALGGLIDGFAEASGLNAANLCDPGDNFRINLSIGLDLPKANKGPYQPSCTLTQLKDNWTEAYSDPKFKDYLRLQYDSTANPIGISLEASNATLVAQADAEEAAKVERLKSSFRNVEQKVSKTISTPGDYIQYKLLAQEANTQSVTQQMIGNPIVDAVSVFGSTLISKLLERAQKGIANLTSGGVLPELISGESAGVSTGRSAAEEIFAELRQPTFVSSGVFDILSELSSCPEDDTVTTVNNCAIGQVMQLAISEGWTVKEFNDYQTTNGGSYKLAQDDLTGTDILGDSGITRKGIILLKKYRIIPVGWQVAADYLEATNQSVTLKQATDCYDACGTDAGSCDADLRLKDDTGEVTNYSPFCRLVDPNWVLKAPQNFCEREAPGPDFASLEDIDNDSNINTQSTLVGSRLNYCADSRGCIQEDQSGVCSAYGYCTAESRIYRFDGESCAPVNASCQTFVDADGNENSYIKSSLNYNDCATDPGCQWYCASQNDAGQFDCASPTSTYVSCSSDVGTNESDYGLTYDVEYNDNQACLCETNQTCTVPAGSDSGDNDGDGLIDFRECLVSNTDGSDSVCTLTDNCGASNPNYNPATGQCTCSEKNSATVEFGDTSFDMSVTASDGSDAVHTCRLNDENNNGSPDACSDTYSTYSTAPVCEVATVGLMNCGDTCTTQPGGTCVNSLGNSCTDGDATFDEDGTANGKCTLVDQCAVATGQYSCTSANGNICVLGTMTEDPTVVNDTLYFDNNIKSCESSNAGCTQYIRIQSDTNLIPNAYFDYFDENRNTINDSDTDGNLDPILDGDDIAFCSHDGDGCSQDSDCDENSDGTPEGQCVGWIQTDVTAYVLDGQFNSLVTPDLGTNYIQMPSDTAGAGNGILETTVDTGQDLENRTFTFSYRAMSLNPGCDDVSFTIGTGDSQQVSAPVTADSEGNEYSYTDEWQDYTTTYTFPDASNPSATYSSSGAGTTIKMAIKESASCDINIAGAQLIEADEFADQYSNYAETNLTSLQELDSCEPADVGCELYIEDGKDEDEGIPGTITNPSEDVCVDDDGNYDYSNPSCNQCNGNPEADQTDEYYVGCSFYQEVPLDSTAPLTEVPTWLTAGSDAYDGVIKRLGGYCEIDSATHCYVDSDCDSGACIDSASIVPSSGEQCSASEVGCEEYTNLAAVEAGGEGLEYYTQLQQCVRTDDAETAVYYTFEGSDAGGVEIQDHTLKVNSDTGAPCTHLDPQSEDYNAECVDSTYTATQQTSWNCGPDGDIDADGSVNENDPTTDAEEYGTDADCRQYIDEAGTIYYRYESKVIKASEDCTPLRNSLDTRAYFAITADSASCSANAVGCREYKGTDSGSEETIIDEGFDDNSTADWTGAETTANESVLQAGHSLQLHDSDETNTSNQEIRHALFTKTDLDGDGVEDTAGLLEAGTSYVLSFWAKVADNTGKCNDGASMTEAECVAGGGNWDNASGDLIVAFDFDSAAADNNYYFTATGYNTTEAAVRLQSNDEDDNWKYYTVGPIVLPESENLDEGDEYFVLDFTGKFATTHAYIDTILLTQSNSQYVIQDSANTCNGFEGCRQYEDRAGNDYYLKSFKRLCADSVVGCEALIATQNSTHPFAEAYNVDNEYDQDDVIVPYDQPVTLVYDDNKQCTSEAVGCTALGLPDVDEQTGQITDYQTVYYLNQPDQYSSTLCEQPQLACQTYTSDYDGTVYFKDPGTRVCELQEYTFQGNTYEGWFKNDSSATTPDCPVQYDFSQYDIIDPSQPLGGVCNSNSNNPGVDNRVGKLCNQDADCYPDGWSTEDPRPRCISNLADDIDVNDGGTHQYVTTQDDGVTLSDSVDDFGWVGLCPEAQSGCSEYVDPYSPNIEEINRNWSFEDDVRDDSNIYYANGATPTGFPDWWVIPYNTDWVDTNTDGLVDSNEYTAIDIDNDGTTDFANATCQAKNATITAATNYTGDQVLAADGDAAVALGGSCVIENSGKYYPLAANKTYTVQGQVKMDKALLDDGSNTPAAFSIGVHYYINDTILDSDDLPDLVTVDDTELYPVAQEATINTETGSDEDNLSYWYRWQGNIGLGTPVPVPIVAQCNDTRYGDETSCKNSGNCSIGSLTNKTSCESASGTWTANTWSDQPVPFARVFIANHSSSTIYFDALSFKEVDKYYYLDYSVDGTAEREQNDGTNSCIDQDTDESAITSDGGCVAFRDTTSDSQNYSQDGLDCTTCLLTPNSDSCRYIVDACDTNTILKVKKDRICSEWLGCETAKLVEDNKGNVTTQCFAINRCTQLDKDGNCSSWVAKPSYESLSSSSDLHYTSAISDADSLQGMSNLTGYSKVGVTWNNVLRCTGGPYDGRTCTSDAGCVNTSIACTDSICSNTGVACVDAYDCYGDNDAGSCSKPVSTEGYYPYGWMTEIGEYGAQTGEDLIELRDFENLYCSGGLAEGTVACIDNATGAGDPGQCYTTDLIQEVDSDPSDDLTGYTDVVYVDDGSPQVGEKFADDPANVELAFCPNSPNYGSFWPFGGGSGLQYTDAGWTAIGDSSIFVTQYENYKDCPAPCSDIDLNNVLQVGPKQDDTGEAFTGGAQYDLADNIVQGGNYALSFAARYVDEYNGVDEGGIPSSVSVCLRHNNIKDSGGQELDRKDCYVNGFGMADIIFIVDTSGSMDDVPYTDADGGSHNSGGPIATIREAIPDLAASLADSGIDAKFAVVDMEDDTHNQDSDGSSTDEFNTLELDLSSNITEVTNIFSSSCQDEYIVGAKETCLLADSASVDPWYALTQAINGTFDDYNSSKTVDSAIGYRSEAQPIIVLVTDTHDEKTGNSYTESSVQNLLLQADFPIMIVTDDNTATYYNAIARYSGGDISDGITDLDWTAGADSVNSSILEIILDNVDIFQFNNDLDTYTLGPLTIDQKYVDEAAGEYADGTITTDLEFLTSDGASFQLDNASLLPVLEVNKDLDPITRSCRAYPEDDSLVCTYTEPTGTQFKGWKGYCVEVDPLSTNKCLVWWPLDVLEGEESIVQREPAGYTGRSSVYTCMVSRGLSRPAFCNEDDYDSTSDKYFRTWGEGVLCGSLDSDIDAATCGGSLSVAAADDGGSGGGYTGVGGNSQGCFYGANYVLEDPTDPNGGVNEHDTVDSNGDGLQDYVQTESLTIDGGECLIQTDDEGEKLSSDCSIWPSGGSCSGFDNASAYSDKETCQTASGTWNDNTDIMSNVAILDTGDCVDIDEDYNDDYGDDIDISNVDSYCFYDVDGTGGPEVRSTRSCTSDTTCRTATTDSYNCARLECQRGDYSESCTVGGAECESTSAADVDRPYTMTPLRWQMHDPWEGQDGYQTKTPGGGRGDGADVTNNYEFGIITRLPANELLRNVNIKEMQVIEFNPGSAGSGSGGGPEYPFWGQLNGNKEHPGLYDSGDLNHLDAIGNIWLTDLLRGAIQSDDDGSISDQATDFNCYPYRDGDYAGFGCRYWGLWDSDMEWGQYDSESLPDVSADDDDGTGNNDLVYTFVWSNFDWGVQYNSVDCNLAADDQYPLNRYDTLVKNFDDWFKSGCVDSALKAVAGPKEDNRNPFEHVERNMQHIWDKIYLKDVANEGSATVLFNQDDIDDWEGWGDPDDGDVVNPSNWTGHQGGSNLMSLFLDVNDDGYIQAAYVLLWFGAMGTNDYPYWSTDAGVETTIENMMHLSVQTRESCTLIDESVDANGANYAWAQRFNQDGSSGYEINHNNDTRYDVTEDYPPFGSITPLPDTPDSDSWDYLPTDLDGSDGQGDVSGYGTFNKQPIVSYEPKDDDNITSGHPLTCIGDCSVKACVGDPVFVGKTCDISRDCGNGLCMGIGDSTISGEGLKVAYASGTSQLNGVVDDARNRLKFVLAAVKSGNFYRADFGSDELYIDDGIDYWDTDLNGSDQNIFSTMKQCATGDGQRPLDQWGQEAEYCGALPVVISMSINDETGGSNDTYSIDNGQTVTFKFTASVDGEQQPLNNIYIDWGDGTSPVNELWGAQPAQFTYTHAYNCGPENTGRYKGDHCEFKPKVVVVDNWNWCSGMQGGTCNQPQYTTEEACTDHSSIGAVWTDGADHRYTPDSGSNNIIANCQSYDEPGVTINVDAAS